MLTAFVAINAIVAAAYILLAAISATLVRVPHVSRALSYGISAAFTVFFLGCGARHMHHTVNAALDPDRYAFLLTPHSIIIDGAQAVAAPVAAVLSLLALRKLAITIERQTDSENPHE
jgi:hypothetical protein